jgi:hypothetical protein
MFRRSSKGIALIIASLLVLMFLGLSVFIFSQLFRYYITIQIISGDLKSKSSLIPLVLVSSDFNGENLIIGINKNDNALKGDVENIVSKYSDIGGRTGVVHLFCYKLKIDDFEINHGPPIGCKKRSFYRIVYPFPKIFDGKDFITDFEFATYKVSGGEQ